MNINQWKQSGEISLWRYEGNPKNYRGHHLTCNNEGAKSFTELICLLIDAETELKRTIILSKPTETDLLVPNCNKKVILTEKLQISNNISNIDAWQLTNYDKSILLSVGNNMLSKLKTGINDISKNEGDYSIGNNNDQLWFW